MRHGSRRTKGSARAATLLTAAAGLAALAAPSVAGAQSGDAYQFDDLLPAGATEADVRAMESMMLGPEHAAEHAAVRAADRGDGSRAVGPGGAEMALSSEDAPAAALAVEGPPSEIGEWTQAPFTLPTYAINSTLLPTGKVLFWGRPPRPEGGGTPENVGEASLWSPWLGTGPGAFTDVEPPVIDPDGPGGQPPGPAPFFCSGLSHLPNGEVAVAGGTLIYAGTFDDDAFTNFAGLETMFTFDPFSETWIQQPSLADGRWYPTQLLLPDGRTVVAGGHTQDPPGGINSDSIEIFHPPAALGGQGTVSQHPSADRDGLGLYPRLFTLGDDVLLAGPRKTQVAVLDTDSFTWDESPPSMSISRLADNAVRRPGSPSGSDAITAVGGYEKPVGGGPFFPATTTSETFDAGQPAPAWSASAPLNVGRANSNTVLLPDGSMAAVGGGSGFDEDSGGGYVVYADGRARQIELYDPETNSWELGPAQQEDRAYHSTAVLLPDGRVLSAGDDHAPEQPNGENSRTDTAEIYSPPYLFAGPRPTIGSAPQTVAWGDAFGIESTSGGIERAVLMAPSATTHGVDMHQRHVELEVQDTFAGEGINVVSPPSAQVAPPGYYMLFLINDTGVPSVASWVKIDPTAPDQPLIGPPPAPPKGDFNGDGYVDRAVGVPLEDVGAASDAGVINVLYGSAAGLASAGNQVFSQDDLRGGPGSVQAGDKLGSALTSGDFDHDGFSDLAVGVPAEDIGSAADAGTVEILYGSAAGLAPGAQHWNQDSGTIADVAEGGDRLGAALAAGDLNNDGNDDLILGASGESVGTVAGAGAVNVIYGSAGGLTSTGNQFFHQNSPGVGEAADSGDAFGGALATGDLNGDGRDDVAVGAPAETVGTTAGAGAVNVIFGSATGLTSTGSQLWHQNSSGIGEKVEAGDSFGGALAAADLNGDTRDDLAIGVRSESVGSTAGAGSVNVIFGAAGGLTPTGNQLWSQNTAQVLEAGEAGDSFGAALAAAELSGDGFADLAIGVPSESVGTVAGAGAVNVLYGSGAGLSAAGNQLWNQNSAAVLDAGEAQDAFGASLGAGTFNTDARADLAVGVPSESVGTSAGAGAVNVLYSAGAGLSSTGNQLWSQDSADILEVAEPGDTFGAVLGAGAR